MHRRNAAEFSAEETTWAAARILRAWVEQYGVPRGVHRLEQRLLGEADTQGGTARRVPVSQFGRMCARLGIEIIAASSPQGKGRVERHHGTHQDRLVKKLRVKQISDCEKANESLTAYLIEHNARFTQLAAEAPDYHGRRPTGEQL